ncbi:hypothetical protein PHZ_c0090 [Phenylobacterium zucineum HLK1]|uniref:Uncharacterized protein n=1 Tax=Phenylobacterium zucineum (strain HLK1) TaxID=450851 RepID=B4RBP4_PHEZH|nr:hypothetical protein [Phenylobacterium zucineum]ACG76504.1 hypothetical protein PHZ_c0090 [Phenylobacterium zucineum HLK1]
MQIPSPASAFVPPTTGFGGFAAKPPERSAAAAEFLSYAQKTAAEQMREQVLRALGVTEDEVRAMDPKEREKLEEKVREMIEQKVREDTEQRTGLLVDVRA